MKKMRFILSIVLFLIIITTITLSIYKASIKVRKTTYKINDYKINEKFYLDEKQHNYDITISNKTNNYNYIITRDLSKAKKIISDIKEYKKNNLECIVPEYKKELEKSIYCTLDNNQISIDYLIKTNNKDFKKIQEKIKDRKIEYPQEDNIKEKYKKISIYKNNIEDNEIIYIWDYKGIYIVDKEQVDYKKIIKKDLYDNIISTTVDNNFILFENNSVSGIEKVYYYNYRKNKVKKVKVKEKISKEIYINGVYDKLLYFTDTRNKKQYTLNIKKGKIEEVDNNQTEYIIYKNNKKVTLSKSDFFMNKQLFDNYDVIYNDILSKEDNKYYYQLIENSFYRINKNTGNKELLFELEGIKEWYINNENIYVISHDYLYKYNDKLGLNKIIKSNELKYNYKNITKIGKK